jgi:hypothetical protein
MYKLELNYNIKNFKVVENIELNNKINKLISAEVVKYYLHDNLFTVNDCFIEFQNNLNNCLEIINKIKDIKLFDILSLNLLDNITNTPNNNDVEEYESDENIEINNDKITDILECINESEKLTNNNYIDIKIYLKSNKPALCKDYIGVDLDYTIDNYYLRKGGNSIRCYFTLLQYPNIVFKDNNTIKDILVAKTNQQNYCKTIKSSILINCYEINKDVCEFVEIY